MRDFLVIDNGNTQAKFGFVRDGVIIQTLSILNADICNRNVIALLRENGFPLEAFVILASVVPDISTRLKSVFSCPVYCVDHQHCGGLLLDVPNPAEVGADRLVNAYAAWKMNGVSQLMIDFGTATTFDVLDRQGCYSGGLILPGMDLSLRTLHDATAKLPLVKIQRAKNVLGKTTIEAINQGLYWGYIAMIEGLIMRLQSEQGDQFHVTATGGYADLLARDCSLITDIDTELTLKGLALLAENEWI